METIYVFEDKKAFDKYRQETNQPDINGVSEENLAYLYEFNVNVFLMDNSTNKGCFDCYHCDNCVECYGCEGCNNCLHCVDCNSCTRCAYSENCEKCVSCYECEYCTNCRACSFCKDSKNLIICDYYTENKEIKQWN